MMMSNIPSSTEELQQFVIKTIDKTVRLKDLPPGTSLAKQLALNYGDINLQEASDVFAFGISIWGKSRIGGNKR
jgi:hypothetical protein